MMQHMRTRAKWYFFLTAGAFILFGFITWGSGTLGLRGNKSLPSNEAGRVNGEPITYTEYQQAVNRAFAQYAQNGQKEIGDAERANIEEQVWQQIVQSRIMQQLVQKAGITVTDDEVVQTVRTSPPQEIATLPQFQTNGQFDPAKYNAALTNPNIDWSPIEAQVRETLPIQKLQMRVLSGVVVSEAEVRARYVQMNEAASVTYAYAPVSQMPVDSAGLTEEAVEKYYTGHGADYESPEMVKVFVAQIPKTPSEADRAQALETVRGVMDEIRAGRDFAEMAKSASEGPWAEQGGVSPQVIPWERMAPIVRETLQKMGPGDVSAPVADLQAAHLLKLVSLGTTTDGKPGATYADIAVRVRAGDESVRQANDKAHQLLERAKSAGLQQAATEMKIPAGETGYFDKDTAIPGLETLGLTDFAFHSKVGSLSPVFDRPSANFIVKLMDRRPAGRRPLAEVRTQVKQALVRQRQLDASKAHVESAVRAMKGGATLEVAATANGLTLAAPATLQRMREVPGLGLAPRVVGTAFGLAVGKTSGAIETDNGYAVIRVNTRTTADMSGYPAQRTQLRQQVTQEKQQAAFSRWFQDVIKAADIRDNRARITAGT